MVTYVIPVMGVCRLSTRFYKKCLRWGLCHGAVTDGKVALFHHTDQQVHCCIHPQKNQSRDSWIRAPTFTAASLTIAQR